MQADMTKENEFMEKVLFSANFYLVTKNLTISKIIFINHVGEKKCSLNNSKRKKLLENHIKVPSFQNYQN